MLGPLLANWVQVTKTLNKLPEGDGRQGARCLCRADMLPAMLRNQLLRDQIVHMSGG